MTGSGGEPLGCDLEEDCQTAAHAESGAGSLRASSEEGCGGTAASASAGVRAPREALRKTGNNYSRDSSAQGGEMLPVTYRTAAFTTCFLLADEQQLPGPKCHCRCVHLGTYQFIQLENKKYNLP